MGGDRIVRWGCAVGRRGAPWTLAMLGMPDLRGRVHKILKLGRQVAAGTIA